ncbi:MAG: adaptor protein MecA [Defluviitaleaceae bacterium]|nr:adaptor protein MecA [Defluviitaleaceae bacterium]
MKIEKISDTKMKFVLRQPDLEERDIKISELSHSSDKTQALFREIIQMAQDEGAFPSDSTTYLIEAMRVGVDSLAVIVTTMEADDINKNFSLVPAAKGHCRYKRNEYIDKGEYPGEDSHSIFSFRNLDIAASACMAIFPIFEGDSQLYKLEGRFCLWLVNETQDNRSTADLEAILSEFGVKHISNELSKQYLLEHGKIIIKDDAVEKLGQYMANT